MEAQSMNIYIDTEFLEYPSTIELISIGLVKETGEELYLENKDADVSKADDWLKTNVLANLKGNGVSRQEIREAILEFTSGIKPKFYGYFADYDWVVFCWIFGKMIDLPKHFPMYCRDIKQLMDDYDISKRELPKQTNKHIAIDDARWNKAAHDKIQEIIKTLSLRWHH